MNYLLNEILKRSNIGNIDFLPDNEEEIDKILNDIKRFKQKKDKDL